MYTVLGNLQFINRQAICKKIFVDILVAAGEHRLGRTRAFRQKAGNWATASKCQKSEKNGQNNSNHLGITIPTR